MNNKRNLIMTAGLFRFAHRERNRGNAVLETVLVLSLVLLPVLFITAEWGYYLYVKNCLQAAAREGARVAILATSDNTDVTTAVDDAMRPTSIPKANYTIKVTDLNNNPLTLSGLAAGTNIKVSVECTWGTVGWKSAFPTIGSNKKVLGITVMRRE
ncbi:MAG: pilus assembly protein [Phycisphaerales bacterium]|jgi:Flp pilus assembly protein TadG|nr:pilus assembly protein [Phycisphaerales bacterium]